MNERDLITRAVDKDQESFNLLIDPYVNQAYKTSYLILNDKGLSEDAVQEALYQTYISLYKFDANKAQFKTWFNKIVINCTLKMKRNIFYFFELKHEIKKVELSIEDNYNSKEENKIIYNAIHNLSIKLRTVITLFYFQEFSIQEISQILDISDGTVKSRLFKGRKNLEKSLKNNIDFGSDQLWIKK